MIESRVKRAEQRTQQRIEARPWWAVLIVGIVAILMGIYLLVSPKNAATDIFWLLGVFFLAGGIVSLVAIARSRQNWGWKLLTGALGIILGLVFLGQPLASAYLGSAIVVWLLGAAAILYGIVLIIQGIAYAGWGHTILGILSLLFGVLVIFGSAIGALTMPWVFGLLAIAGGVLAVVQAIRIFRLRRS